ncbi:MAG: hypothetical protein ABR558_06850 [Thioalkalivibrio sp.]
MIKVGKAATKKRKPVTVRAILARINRRLAHEDAQLWKTPPGGDQEALGRWHITRDGEIDRVHVDPRALAVWLRVLEPWEYITDPTGHLERVAPENDNKTE